MCAAGADQTINFAAGDVKMDHANVFEAAAFSGRTSTLRLALELGAPFTLAGAQVFLRKHRLTPDLLSLFAAELTALIDDGREGDRDVIISGLLSWVYQLNPIVFAIIDKFNSRKFYDRRISEAIPLLLRLGVDLNARTGPDASWRRGVTFEQEYYIHQFIGRLAGMRPLQVAAWLGMSKTATALLRAGVPVKDDREEHSTSPPLTRVSAFRRCFLDARRGETESILTPPPRRLAHASGRGLQCPTYRLLLGVSHAGFHRDGQFVADPCWRRYVAGRRTHVVVTRKLWLTGRAFLPGHFWPAPGAGSANRAALFHRMRFNGALRRLFALPDDALHVVLLFYLS